MVTEARDGEREPKEIGLAINIQVEDIEHDLALAHPVHSDHLDRKATHNTKNTHSS